MSGPVSYAWSPDPGTGPSTILAPGAPRDPLDHSWHGDQMPGEKQGGVSVAPRHRLKIQAAAKSGTKGSPHFVQISRIPESLGAARLAVACRADAIPGLELLREVASAGIADLLGDPGDPLLALEQ